MRKRALALAAAVTSGLLAPAALTAPATAATAASADDFNGDGYRDLAVGDRGATVGGAEKAGAVVVVYGSATGLGPASRSTTVSQNSAGIPGSAEAGDGFGTDITTRDLNSDGYADVIATAPGENDGSYHGTFTVLWGSASGLTSGSAYKNPKYPDKGFAKDLAVGDFNADGKQDVVAVDDDNIWYLRGPFTKSGSRGSATNLDPTDGENISPTASSRAPSRRTAPPTSRSSATTGTPTATASGSTRVRRAAPPRPRRSACPPPPPSWRPRSPSPTTTRTATAT